MRTPRPRFRPASRRRAFTTIEILTAVGIIALLASIAIVGMSHMVSSTKTTSTKVDLQNLMSMTTEMSSSGTLKRPVEWVWGAAIVQPTATTPTPVNADSFDFWKVPYRDGTTALDKPSALPCPGNVDRANLATWQSNAGIVNTATALWRLQTLPTNKTAIAKFPVDRRAPIANFGGTALDESQYPLVTDQWGRPILFVPGSGLANVTVGGTVVTVRSPDGRYFWVSAGDDGDFSKGDDNVYSFDQ